MKRWQKIVGTLFIASVLSVGGISYWQRENIHTLLTGLQYSSEVLQEQMIASQDAVNQILTQYHLDTMRTLTIEEMEQLETGELSIEEATNRLVASLGNKENGQETELENKNLDQVINEEAKEQVSPEAQLVASYTAKMYALRGKYMGQLKGIESQGWALLNQYKSGSQSISKLTSQGMSLMGQATKLESQCDREVEDVLASLLQELKAIKGDTQVVQTMRQAYYTEKSAQKAYYVSLIPSRNS